MSATVTCKQGLRCACRNNNLAKAPSKCQRAIGKAYGKFAAAHVKAEGKCESDLAAGKECDAAKAISKIDRAAEKAETLVRRSCEDIDLSGLTPGGCVVGVDGTPNTLDEIVSCLDGTHRELAEDLVGNEFGAIARTRCCVIGVCTRVKPSECVGIGVDVGPGLCRPNPC